MITGAYFALITSLSKKLQNPMLNIVIHASKYRAQSLRHLVYRASESIHVVMNFIAKREKAQSRHHVKMVYYFQFIILLTLLEMEK